MIFSFLYCVSLNNMTLGKLRCRAAHSDLLSPFFWKVSPLLPHNLAPFCKLSLDDHELSNNVENRDFLGLTPELRLRPDPCAARMLVQLTSTEGEPFPWRYYGCPPTNGHSCCISDSVSRRRKEEVGPLEGLLHRWFLIRSSVVWTCWAAQPI